MIARNESTKLKRMPDTALSKSAGESVKTSEWPIDPLQRVTGSADVEFRRRMVQGILDSYHSNYDVLAEGLQNAIDAVEDAKLSGLPGPYSIDVTVNLKDNSISILDTGVGMTFDQVASAFA